MDPRSKVLQKPIYQAIFKIWGAESSFINTGICISIGTPSLIQCNDEHAYPINDEHTTLLTIVNRCRGVHNLTIGCICGFDYYPQIRICLRIENFQFDIDKRRRSVYNNI